jgi:zinc/manganese transport system substrate-binding protein
MRFLSALLFSTVAALGHAASEPAPRPPTVVTANTILDDLVRQVGGDQATTHCLIAPGADPHTFEPRPSDVKQLVRADLLVVNGLNLEPAILRLAHNSGFKGEIVVATTGLTPRTGGCTHDHHAEHNSGTPCSSAVSVADHEHSATCAHEHSGSSLATPSTGHRPPATTPHSPLSGLPSPVSSEDPHAWQSPLAVKTYVANLRDALTRARPAAAAHYSARAAAYLAQLDALDLWVREQVATIPPARRKLVTSHDSLGYFADAYGLETIPVAGLSSSAEPDARAVAGIIDLIRHEQVPAVFIELTTNPKLLRQIGADAGVRLADPLFTDSLGAPDSGADTYLGIIRTNTTRIVSALK